MRDNEANFSGQLANGNHEKKSCRQLTFDDVQQALLTLTTNGSEPETPSVLVVKTCCHLLRLDRSARLSLPLARRSRSEFSNHPSSLLCANCTAIKEQQQLHLFRSQALDRREIEFSLIDDREKLALSTTSNYQSAQMLVWQVNSSTSRHTLDTGALTEEEKKTLLNDTIKKLQSMLSHPSSTSTRHALETSLRVLSSAIDSS